MKIFISVIISSLFLIGSALLAEEKAAPANTGKGQKKADSKDKSEVRKKAKDRRQTVKDRRKARQKAQKQRLEARKAAKQQK